MSRLIWTQRALTDVERLHRFLLPYDPDAARRAVATIRASVRLIADHPGAGRPIADMDGDYRERLIDFGASGYVLLYRVDSDVVALLAVRHQREAGYR